MGLPEELRKLSASTEIPFRPKWEFFGPIQTDFNVGILGRCYESRYKGHAIRYHKRSGVEEYDSGQGYVRNILTLFYSRPLNLGLQCYSNVGRISPTDLRVGQGRNAFASKLSTPFPDIKCYASKRELAESLLSQRGTVETLSKLRNIAQGLPAGGFVLQDYAVMVYFYEGPDEGMLDTMHELSTVLTASTVLPSKRNYRTFDLGLLLGILAFLGTLTLAIVLLRREGFIWPLGS